MKFVFWFLLIGLLSIVVYQDFRERAISWWLIPSLILLSMGIASQHQEMSIQFALINLFFVLIMLLGLTLYFSLKHRQLINISKAYLGLGDILFFIPLCVLFSPLHFIVFFVSSLLLILLAYALLSLFYSIKTIPLAGGMALCIPLYCGLFDQYDDWIILTTIYGY